MVSVFKNAVNTKVKLQHNKSKTKTKKNNTKSVKNQKGGYIFDLSYIKKIEGPVYVGVLEPTELLKTFFNDSEDLEVEVEVKEEPPNVLLLGDLHIGSDTCNESCDTSKGCYSLYEDKDFSLFKDLDEKARLNSVKIDLFVETWFDVVN